MSENQTNSDKPDNAGVKFPPPLIFLGFLLIGLYFDSAWWQGQLAGTALMVAGGLIALCGLGQILISALGHRRVGTNIEPWEPTTVIVTTGLYGKTRNPIYLGLAFLHVGLAVAAGSVVGCLTVIGSIAVVQTYVIGREERYLEEKFGQPYVDYKAKVRRWI